MHLTFNILTSIHPALTRLPSVAHKQNKHKVTYLRNSITVANLTHMKPRPNENILIVKPTTLTGLRYWTKAGPLKFIENPGDL